MYLDVLAVHAIMGLHLASSVMGVSQGARDPVAQSEVSGLKIICTDLRVTEDMLELCYEIRNGSTRDIWLCERLSVFSADPEVYLDDSGTLMIRRRFDLKTGANWGVPRTGSYIRLRPGERRCESLIVPVPVHMDTVFADRGVSKGGGVAGRLTLEIGFYDDDLRERVLDLCAESLTERKKTGPPFDNTYFFPGLSFNNDNEGLRDRDNRILILYMGASPEGGQSVKLTLEDQQIPVAATSSDPDIFQYFRPPDLSGCTRVVVHFEPSPLGYLFPNANEQSLLSPVEKAAILAMAEVDASDPQRIAAFVREIGKGNCRNGGVIAEGPTARVTCYRGENQAASFILHGDSLLEINRLRRCVYALGLPSLRQLTPQIQQFELRMRCATNLEDLWNRFRLFHWSRDVYSDGKGELTYPQPARWCDDLLEVYPSGIARYQFTRPYICPGANPGECHYAVNPVCGPDSPPDMVLLFETAAGWNQHGGPELFTFDNHNPKGGLVLLNDATVKFIRTEEELKQLRWK